MVRYLFAILTCVFFLSVANALSANVGTVRAGEHDSFTRVTISITAPIESFRQVSNKNGNAVIDIEPKLTSIDGSKLEDRIYSGRVNDVIAQNGAISIALGCPCDVAISRDGKSLLVVDIFEQVRPRISLARAYGLRRRFLPYPVAPTSLEVKRSLAFTKSRAIGSGFRIALREAMDENSKAWIDQESCHFSSGFGNQKALVRIVPPKTIRNVRDSRNNEYLTNQVLSLEDDIEILYFFESGFFKEVKSVYSVEKIRPVFRYYLRQYLDETNSSNLFDSQGDELICFLEELLLNRFPTSKHREYLTSVARIDLMKVFLKLPLGLQLALYSNLKNHTVGEMQGGYRIFEEFLDVGIFLNRHSKRFGVGFDESSLLDQRPGARLGIFEVQDEREIESSAWIEHIEEHLRNGRFFEALRYWDRRGKQIENDTRRIATVFVHTLIDESDLPVFLEITRVMPEDLLNLAADAVVESFVLRLREEGFADLADDWFSRLSNSSGLEQQSSQERSPQSQGFSSRSEYLEVRDFLQIEDEVGQERKGGVAFLGSRAIEDVSNSGPQLITTVADALDKVEETENLIQDLSRVFLDEID